eukprot:g10613.t1
MKKRKTEKKAQTAAELFADISPASRRMTAHEAAHLQSACSTSGKAARWPKPRHQHSIDIVLDSLGENLTEIQRTNLKQWFMNDVYRRRETDSQHASESFQLIADFAVEQSCKALRAALDVSYHARHVLLRLEMDGTSREVKDSSGYVDRRAKWMASRLSCWFSSEKTAPEEWPRWSYLPTHTHYCIPGKDLPEGLLPGDRSAKLGLDMLLPYIMATPRGQLLSIIVCGDAAESPMICALMSTLDETIRRVRPDILFLPHCHRCGVHQTTIIGEDSSAVFLNLCGTPKKPFYKKICLQVLQKRRQALRFQQRIADQQAASLRVLTPSEKTPEWIAHAAEYAEFLKDMQHEKAAVEFAGCAPYVAKPEEGEGGFGRFTVKAPNEDRKDRAAKQWKAFYKKLREPRENRWLTVGHGARTEAVHDSLNAAGLISDTKPWLFSAEDWADFKASRHLDERYSCQKVLLGHLFTPLDFITELQLSTAGSCTSPQALLTEGQTSFQGTQAKLYEENRIKMQMLFATLFSPRSSDADKTSMRMNLIAALQCGFAIFFWRQTSGARDPHESRRQEFQDAEAQGASFFAPGGGGIEYRKKVAKKIIRSAESKLVNEPGSVCCISWSKTLARLPIADAVRVFTSFVHGLELSATHQAGCERLIAMAKAEQQANLHAYKGMARISEAVTRRKLSAARVAAQSWERYGDPEQSEDGDSEANDDDSDADDFWLTAADAKAERERKSGQDAAAKLDRHLMKLKRGPNWYSEFLRSIYEPGTQRLFEKGARSISSAVKEEMKGVAAQKRARRAELLADAEAREAEIERRETKRRVARQRRAVVEKTFFDELEKLVCTFVAAGGTEGGGGRKVSGGPTWTHKKRLADLKKRIYTQHIKAFDYASSLVELWKMAPTGVERMLAWVISCRIGKEECCKLNKCFDAADRSTELDKLQADFGDTTLTTAFDNPRALLALEFPPLPVTASPSSVDDEERRAKESTPHYVVVLHVERSPFSFVGASAKLDGESSSTLLVDDVIATGKPFASALHRRELGRYNKKTIRLLAVEYSSAEKGRLEVKINWGKEFKVPQHGKQEKQEVGPAAAATDSEAILVGGAVPQKAQGEGNIIQKIKAKELAEKEAKAAAAYGPRIVRVRYDKVEEEKDEKTGDRREEWGMGAKRKRGR